MIPQENTVRPMVGYTLDTVVTSSRIAHPGKTVLTAPGILFVFCCKGTKEATPLARV